MTAASIDFTHQYRVDLPVHKWPVSHPFAELGPTCRCPVCNRIHGASLLHMSPHIRMHVKNKDISRERADAILKPFRRKHFNPKSKSL